MSLWLPGHSDTCPIMDMMRNIPCYVVGLYSSRCSDIIQCNYYLTREVQEYITRFDVPLCCRYSSEFTGRPFTRAFHKEPVPGKNTREDALLRTTDARKNDPGRNLLSFPSAWLLLHYYTTVLPRHEFLYPYKPSPGGHLPFIASGDYRACRR